MRVVMLSLIMLLLCSSQLQSQQLSNANFSLAVEKANTDLLKALSENSENRFSLELVHQITSKTADHFSFQLLNSSVPIKGITIPYHVGRDGNLIAVNNKDDELSRSLFASKWNAAIPSKSQHFFPADEEILSEKKIWLKMGREYYLCNEVIHENKMDGIQTNSYFHNSELLHAEISSIFNQLPDTVAQAKVFYPDPLTTAEKYYDEGDGDAYTDRNDGDFPDLNNERIDVEIKCDFHDGIYRLENDYIKIANLSGPNIAPASSVDGTFNFTRAEEGFEDVMAFYHISKLNEMLLAMGFPQLNRKISVDAHGTSSDASFFSKNDQGVSIKFGIGGVDDAEDADVIAHEFFHNFADVAAPTEHSGRGRRAVGEALADYWAFSHSTKISSFRDTEIFVWDSHNEFLPGRDISSSASYPADSTWGWSDFYQESIFLSSAVKAISDDIGNDVTDELVAESTFYLMSGMNLDDQAKNMVLVDELLNGGINKNALYSEFVERNILPLEIELGVVDTLCLGETINLATQNGAVNAFHSQLEYTWAPSNLVQGDFENGFTITATGQTINLTLDVADSRNDIVYSDAIQIHSTFCDSEDLGENILLLNSEAFARSLGELFLYIPEEEELLSFTIYDNSGRSVPFNLNDTEADGIYQLEVASLALGQYIARAEGNTSTELFKFMKLIQF